MEQFFFYFYSTIIYVFKDTEKIVIKIILKENITFYIENFVCKC